MLDTFKFVDPDFAHLILKAVQIDGNACYTGGQWQIGTEDIWVELISQHKGYLPISQATYQVEFMGCLYDFTCHRAEPGLNYMTLHGLLLQTRKEK